jgi:hypothetical protein
VSGFSAEWLALREPADAAARSNELVSFVIRDLDHVVARARCLDLGGGTGANIRYLSTRLPAPQQWTIVDDDAGLLARAPAGVATRHADLSQIVDDDLLRDCALVTASALLDLVSEAWLTRVIDGCRRSGAAVLFALTYDGRTVCGPDEPEDEDITRLVNDHQRRDKGFGAALGPVAAARAAELLSAAGYEVRHEPSDWRLGQADAELQRQLVEGWTKAAVEMKPERAAAFADWRNRRLAHIEAGRSRIVVGHLDVAGIRQGRHLLA